MKAPIVTLTTLSKTTTFSISPSSLHLQADILFLSRVMLVIYYDQPNGKVLWASPGQGQLALVTQRNVI